MRIRTRLRLCAIAAAILAAGPALAGGALFDADDDAGSHYFGIVKDRSGNGIAGAKVTISVPKENSALVVHTESEGQFLTKGFDDTVNLDDIEFECSKEGYEPFAKTHSPKPDANGTVEFTCILSKR